MSRLTEHISSQYLGAANALRSQASRQRIVAYVESYDDVMFWRMVLSQLETSKRYFEIMLPSYASNGRKGLGRGKKSAIKSLLSNTGESMIACVDADYDYLLQGHSEQSMQVLQTPYVFHTYAYAIENMQCYAPGLHQVCVMTTLNDHRVFDFEEYLRQYSQAVYPLLVWSVWLYRHGHYDRMSIYDMDKVITPQHFTLRDSDAIIEHLRQKVRQKVNQLQKAMPQVREQLPALRDELRELGVMPENAYMYIHGHHLFEKVVSPMLCSVCNMLRKEREQEIHSESVHSTQMSNELSCYNASIEDVASMLKRSTGCVLSPQYQQILSALREKLG